MRRLLDLNVDSAGDDGEATKAFLGSVEERARGVREDVEARERSEEELERCRGELERAEADHRLSSHENGTKKLDWRPVYAKAMFSLRRNASICVIENGCAIVLVRVLHEKALKKLDSKPVHAKDMVSSNESFDSLYYWE